MNLSTPSWHAVLVGITGVFYYAASALPLIISLGLIVGRRGNGRFCLWGTEKLLSLALWLSITGPLYILGSYLSVILAFPGINGIWNALFESAGLPFTTSLIAWATGGIFLFLAQSQLAPVIFNFKAADDRYKINHIKLPLIFSLIAALAFFLTFILLHWPFAGLPQGLSWDRAIMAIFRNACRHYFMAFCPAGAIALIYGLHTFNPGSPATEQQKTTSIRWCAVWAIIGYLPYLLQNWGLLIGLGLRKNLPFGIADAMGIQLITLSCLTLAIFCWLLVFITRHWQKLAAWLGFILLLIKEASPQLAKLFI